MYEYVLILVLKHSLGVLQFVIACIYCTCVVILQSLHMQVLHPLQCFAYVCVDKGMHANTKDDLSLTTIPQMEVTWQPFL